MLRATRVLRPLLRVVSPAARLSRRAVSGSSSSSSSSSSAQFQSAAAPVAVAAVISVALAYHAYYDANKPKVEHVEKVEHEEPSQHFAYSAETPPISGDSSSSSSAKQVADATEIITPASSSSNSISNADSPSSLNAPVPVSAPVAASTPRQLEAKYVLVGAGTAAFSALAAIRDREPNADILIVSEESHLPYMRPPLSKELWFELNQEKVDRLEFQDWNGKQRELFYRDANDFASDATKPSKKPRILLGVRAKSLDVDSRLILLEDGTRIKYNKVLLATGGRPKLPSFASDLASDIRSKVTTFRGVDDFKNLHRVVTDSATKNIAIIGGSFLGSELAFAIAQRGRQTGLKVTQVFQEDGNMGALFPRYLSNWTTEKMRKSGVEVIPKSEVTAIGSGENGKVVLTTSDGKIIESDHVVLAVGIEPNTELAEKAGLEIDKNLGGIVVNAELESRTGVFAAGDVSSYHDIALGRRRVEHHDHAMLSGKIAGENMVGTRKPYTHQSMFWSDLGPEIGYEAVGIIDSRLVTVGVWAKNENEKQDAADSNDYGRGVVFYLRDKKIVGVLLWNIFNRVQTARAIIRDGKPVDDVSELANLFRVHE